jgi:hypothetical protein
VNGFADWQDFAGRGAPTLKPDFAPENNQKWPGETGTNADNAATGNGYLAIERARNE